MQTTEQSIVAPDGASEVRPYHHQHHHHEAVSRKSSIRAFYSQTSLATKRAGHTIMSWLKSCHGIGVVLGILCGLSYSLGSLSVKILNSNFRMHPFMLAAIRQFFLFFMAAPQVAYCKAPYGGRTRMEWVLLAIRAACGGIAIVLQFFALSYMEMGDVGVLYAVTPAFTTLFAWIILREKCHFSDIPTLVVAFLGVAFILRPPFIFSSEKLKNDNDDKNRIIGSILAISGSIIQAGLFLALRKMRQMNYATISFFYAFSTAPILIALTLAYDWTKFQMPPCYVDRLIAIGIAASAQGGHIFMTMAAKFIPPGIVSLTRSSEVAFNFMWQVIFLGVSTNIFSIIGLALVATSMAFLSVRQFVTDRYKTKPPPNQFIKVFLIISK